MQAIARFHSLFRTWGHKLGPYVVLEILLPGGTLLALLLFLYRRSRRHVELATSCSTSV